MYIYIKECFRSKMEEMNLNINTKVMEKDINISVNNLFEAGTVEPIYEEGVGMSLEKSLERLEAVSQFLFAQNYSHIFTIGGSSELTLASYRAVMSSMQMEDKLKLTVLHIDSNLHASQSPIISPNSTYFHIIPTAQSQVIHFGCSGQGSPKADVDREILKGNKVVWMSDILGSQSTLLMEYPFSVNTRAAILFANILHEVGSAGGDSRVIVAFNISVLNVLYIYIYILFLGERCARCE